MSAAEGRTQTVACEWCGRAISRFSEVPGMPQWATAKDQRSDCEDSDDGLHGPGHAPDNARSQS